jgi:hypothetical protein
MRKLHEATDGQPQRWESFDNLGAAKADAAWPRPSRLRPSQPLPSPSAWLMAIRSRSTA